MPDFTDLLKNANAALSTLVWGLPMMLLLLGVGLYYSARTGFLQFRKFGYAMRNTIGRAFRREKVSDRGAISPFQALTTALAATVGTGNIAGVAGALSLGGPGAVFWMWVSASLGMITKYAEVLLAVRFRQRNSDGDWVGGPMYYITNGLGKNKKWLADIFSLFGALAAFGIGNMTQVNSAARSAVALVSKFSDLPAGPNGEAGMAIRLAVGFVIAFFSSLVLLGGVRRIGRATEGLVPFMSLIYITGVLAVIFAEPGRIIPAFRSILVGAFRPEAVIGGAAGIGITQALTRGVGRGVFSNEAGLGSAPIAHAATSETDPVKQGLFGIFEVFADTIVMCSLTALAILVSGTPIAYGGPAGAELTISAFSSLFGGKAAALIVTFCITLFASATVLSWSLYGCRCAEYLLGARARKPYKCLFVAFIIVGAGMDLGLVWDLADTLNGLMAIPNLIALLGLSGTVIKLTREHFGK